MLRGVNSTVAQQSSWRPLGCLSSSEAGVSVSGRWYGCFLCIYILGWPKRSFGFFHKILWKNLNELFGQHNTQIYVFFVICFEPVN